MVGEDGAEGASSREVCELVVSLVLWELVRMFVS